jgi:hypothetical protein
MVAMSDENDVQEFPDQPRLQTMVGISDVKTAKKGWVLPGSHVLSSTN